MAAVANPVDLFSDLEHRFEELKAELDDSDKQDLKALSRSCG